MLSSRSGRTPSRPVNSRWDPPSEQAAGASLASTHPAGTTVLERRPSAHTRAGDQIQMNLLKSRALTLLAATALVAAACQGPKAVDGANGADGAAGANGTSGTNGTDGGSGSNGTNGTNGTSGVNAATTGLALTITSTTVNADQTVSVRFTMKDDQGYPVDAKGKYSVNTVIAPKFALAYLIPAADGSVPPYKVLSKAVSHGNLSNFHGGGRVDARYCDICHNTARISTATNSDGVTPAAASGVFVHRIHNAKKLQTVTTGT